MPSVEVEKQIAVVIKFGEAWHRAFKLEEHGERHIMLWKNCPLHDGPDHILPDEILEKLPAGTRPESLCVICFEDEIKALD